MKIKHIIFPSIFLVTSEAKAQTKISWNCCFQEIHSQTLSSAINYYFKQFAVDTSSPNLKVIGKFELLITRDAFLRHCKSNSHWKSRLQKLERWIFDEDITDLRNIEDPVPIWSSAIKLRYLQTCLLFLCRCVWFHRLLLLRIAVSTLFHWLPTRYSQAEIQSSQC